LDFNSPSSRQEEGAVPSFFCMTLRSESKNERTACSPLIPLLHRRRGKHKRNGLREPTALDIPVIAGLN
jgi:hypothetical protein